MAETAEAPADEPAAEEPEEASEQKSGAEELKRISGELQEQMTFFKVRR